MPDYRGWGLVAAQFLLFGVLVLGPSGPGTPGHPAAEFAGGILAAAGLALAVWAIVLLRGALTPLPGPRPGAALITSGPFVLLRHPIYVGIGGVGLGIAMSGGGLVRYAAAIALMGLFVVKSRYEEGLLRARFPEYSAYALTTLASRLRRIGA